MKSLSVLLVDDDWDMREVLRRRLEQSGHRVEAASDGLTAVQLFEKGAFDVVLTDMSMPGMNGTELVRRVKAVAPRTITILITGFGTLESAIAVLRHGCDDYLLKPLSSLDVVDQSIKRCLARRNLLLGPSNSVAPGATNEEMLEFWSEERSRRIAELEEFAARSGASAVASSTRTVGQESKKLLVVDDDETFRDLLVSMFLDQGYDVAAAGRGHEALELALTGGFDLILADRRLPDMDIAEVIRRLRDGGLTVPVLVVTAYAGCLEDNELRRLGAAVVLPKPVKLKVLLRTVAGILADADSPEGVLAMPGTAAV
jgi:CheY-like chemotaxis protein